MLTVVPILLTSALAVPTPQGPSQGPSQASPDPQFVAWRDHIVPTVAEWRWQQIDWRPTLGAGLRAAAAARKPLLLWLMNGHPLGCT